MSGRPQTSVAGWPIPSVRNRSQERVAPPLSVASERQGGRVATTSMTQPNHTEGAPGPVPGTGDSANLQWPPLSSAPQPSRKSSRTGHTNPALKGNDFPPRRMPLKCARIEGFSPRGMSLHRSHRNSCCRLKRSPPRTKSKPKARRGGDPRLSFNEFRTHHASPQAVIRPFANCRPDLVDGSR